jgi:large subunit ribosomal protein L22
MSMKAIAKGNSIPISTKHTVEIGKSIRGKELAKAMKILEDVIEMKVPVQYKRFHGDRGHRKKMGPGGYPKKASEEIIKLLRSAMNNAVQKGMNPEKLVLSKFEIGMAVSKNKRSNRRLGRQTNIHVEVTESD